MVSADEQPAHADGSAVARGRRAAGRVPSASGCHRSVCSDRSEASGSASSFSSRLRSSSEAVDRQAASANDTTSIDHRDGGRAGIVVLLELGDDQQRRDLRAHRHVAGDEDHRAVFAHGARKGQRRSRSDAPGKIVGQHDARRTSAAGRRRGWPPPLRVPCRDLPAPAARVRTTNGSPMKVSAIATAERRVRDLDPELTPAASRASRSARRSR